MADSKRDKRERERESLDRADRKQRHDRKLLRSIVEEERDEALEQYNFVTPAARNSLHHLED